MTHPPARELHDTVLAVIFLQSSGVTLPESSAAESKQHRDCSTSKLQQTQADELVAKKCRDSTARWLCSPNYPENICWLDAKGLGAAAQELEALHAN